MRLTILALAVALSACATAPAPPIAPASGPNYAVAVQWGGTSAPWNPEGAWRLGDRPGQPLLRVEARSNSDGPELVGVANYAGEGPIGFSAAWIGENQYQVSYQWGGTNAPWNKGGIWRIGTRANQRIVALNVASADGGRTMTGVVQYAGEGPIGFRGEAK